MKKVRDGGEKDNGCFIALVPNKTLIIIIIIIIINNNIIIIIIIIIILCKIWVPRVVPEIKGMNLDNLKKKKKPLNDGQSVHRLKLTKLRYSTLGSPLKI